MNSKALQLMCLSDVLVAAATSGEDRHPVGVPGEWTLVEEFTDEFDLQEVDAEKWNRDLAPWGERAWTTDNVYQEDGALQVWAEHSPPHVQREEAFLRHGHTPVP